MLVGNKKDLEDQRDVTYEEANKFAEENGLLFIESSAKTGDHVEEAFLQTASKIFKRIQDGNVDLNAEGVQKRGNVGPDAIEAKPSCNC